ncbi:MAG: RHS repeat-associated core domain-containing protein [Anaerolineaceae bacterium]
MRTVIGETDTLQWILSDHLSSASVTANADGTWNSSIQYTAFGEIRATSGLTATKYRYTGQLAQDVLGLDYYLARWYDPTLNHFIQADSLISNPANPQTWDKYAYAINNPIMFKDPSGHYVCYIEVNGSCHGYASDSSPHAAAIRAQHPNTSSSSPGNSSGNSSRTSTTIIICGNVANCGMSGSVTLQPYIDAANNNASSSISVFSANGNQGDYSGNKEQVAEMVLKLITENPNAIIIAHSAGGDAAIVALARAKAKGLDLTGLKAMIIEPSLSITINVGTPDQSIIGLYDMASSINGPNVRFVAGDTANTTTEFSNSPGYYRPSDQSKIDTIFIVDDLQALGASQYSPTFHIPLVSDFSSPHAEEVYNEILKFLGWK